jgi:hypothetical protein
VGIAVMSNQLGIYRVICHAKPATLFEKPGGELVLRFPTPDRGLETVVIRELTQRVSENFVPIGLEFRAEVKAPTIEEAIVKGASLADGVASFITLVTGAGTPTVRPMLCYEITEGKSEREFRQFFDDATFMNPSKRVLPHIDLIDRIDRFYKIPEPAISERTLRAIRWYRWGTSSADPYDRFVAYWIGLEALNKILQDRLKAEDVKTSCPKCGYSWAPFPTVTGIREFVKQFFEDGGSLYERMHALRINIMHSKVPLDTLSSEVAELAPKAGNVLLAAIYHLLSVTWPWNFPSHILTNAFPFRVVVEARIMSEKIEDAFLDQQDPHFKPEHILVEFGHERKTGGKLRMKVTSRLTAVIGAASKFSVYGWGIQGEGKGELSIDDVSR